MPPTPTTIADALKSTLDLVNNREAQPEAAPNTTEPQPSSGAATTQGEGGHTSALPRLAKPLREAVGAMLKTYAESRAAEEARDFDAWCSADDRRKYAERDVITEARKLCEALEEEDGR